MTRIRLIPIALAAVLTLVLGSSAPAATLDDVPAAGSLTIGNRTYLEDGTVEVEVPSGTLSLSQCESGWFCVWSQPSYTGSFRYKTGTGSKTLGGTVGSFWNNRPAIARLYTNTASTSTCYENGVKKASVSASYSSADQVTLGSSLDC